MGRLLIQFAGTTTAKALTETLSKNVIIVDEDLHQLRLHDGSTAGGHLIGGSSGSGVPVGTIIPFAGNSIPQGYLLCDGSAISRTTYASLFAVIGTIYGAGDGNSTFNLPNILNGSPNHSVTASRLGTHIDGELPDLWGYVNAAGLMDYWGTPYTNYCDSAGVFGCYIDNNNGWGWVRNSGYGFRSGGSTASTISLGFSAQKVHAVYKRTDNVVMPQSTFIGGWLIKYI